MNKILLDKYTSDPAWAETIKLYSGLFDSQDKREEFILNLAESDVLLASECITNSKDEENILTNYIELKCNYILSSNNEPETFSNALKALANINKHNVIKDLIQTIKPNKIQFLGQVMSILPSNKSSLELLTLILLTNPKSYIKIYLNILERLSRDLIYLDTEKIQVIFNLLLTDNTIKAKYALQFYRLYINSINPNTYIEEAKEKIYYLNEIDEIDEWINLLKIEIKLKDLIIKLIDKHGSLKGYFTALKLMERLNEKETLFILSKMFENNEVKIQIILYIYLSINFKYKLDFKNYRDFKTRINQNSLKEYHEFRKVFSKIGVSVEANEFINNLKVGQVLKLRYVSERNNYHLLQINKLINFLLPFEEIKIPKTFNKYETIEAKIIFICYNKNEVYVSTRQLELNNISFNQNYLKLINIDDIVKCNIRQRFENRITVSINGYSKKQLGVYTVPQF
jgi:hypothetical protein